MECPNFKHHEIMKQLLLHIPTPCTESWSDMHPGADGRFCDHCQKTVVDFSTMSDPEIYAYFRKRKDAVCGRFLDTQLNREVIPMIRQPFHPVVPAMLIGAFLVMAIPESGKAQMGKPVAKVMAERKDSVEAIADVVDLPAIEVVGYGVVKQSYIVGATVQCIRQDDLVTSSKKRSFFGRLFDRIFKRKA